MLRASFLSSSLPQQAKRNVPEVSSFQPFVQFSPFLGREQELGELCRLLRSSEVHLLTLVGTGGVGKTCLALQAANRLGDTFVDGLCLVPLAPIRDPELVISTIAQALGLSESGGRPLLQRIKAHLQKKRFLLLLDNVEQVITAAPLLAELLAGCPNLKLLLTSRESLRVQGEHVFSVLPLSLPDPCGLIDRAPTSDAAVLARYPAVQLFIQKARAMRPDFQVTDEHVRSIAGLCIHLDGLPLAIELAARLERRLPVLTGGIRDVSERQLTLRNTIKWSYDLLNPQEQRVFRRLAVFAGGCTLEAIEAVCQAVDGRAINVLSCVMALLDKHLLQYRPQSGDESRLSMLATIREYALECLEMNGEVDRTRRSHAEYYLNLAQEAEPELQKTRQAMWLERLEQEHDNLRAALHWLTGWEDGEKTLRLCAALWRFWFLRGHLSEGRQWLERALTGHRGPMTAIRAKAVEGIGRIVIYQSDFARAAALFAKYQVQFQELGDPRFVALALNALGHVQRLQGNYEAAQSLHEQSLALYREVGDRYGIAETLGLMANKTYFEGNCAGSPTAMLLARKGYRVLLTDKATFPSDIISTHFIHPRGVARLKRWGLLEQVIASNCPPVTNARFDFGSFALAGETLPVEDVTAAYVPRRRILDKILVDAAVDAGVELREGFSVREILTEGDRVTGIRGQHAGSSPVTEQATIVIGADGMRSLVAHQVHALEYNTRPSLTCGYYTYWSGVPVEGVELYPRDRCSLIAFPTNDNLACVIVVWSHQQFHSVRTNVAEQYMKALHLAPSLARRVQGGKQEERFVGTADLPNFFRKPYGPGWALVGDAGYHKDPILGHGISDAFRDAQLVAEAIDAGLSGRCPLEKALAHYERERNEESMSLYELNTQFAELEPPSPQMQRLFNALRTNRAEVNRYFATIEGTIPPSVFFSSENIARILAEADQRASLP